MRARGAAWRKLAFAWVPAVIFLVGNAAVLVWQTSAGHGREARLEHDVGELSQKVQELRGVKRSVAEQQRDVKELDSQLTTLYEENFGSLDERLTGIMRAVGNATRGAGLMPSGYTYDAKKDKGLGLVEFGISFAVRGDYAQVRSMLAAVQASTELLTVDRISFSGDQGVTTRQIDITVHVTTYVARADQALLDRLIGPARAAAQPAEETPGAADSAGGSE